MEFDDIIYLLLLILMLIFGQFFRRLGTTYSKKWISTGVGFLVVFFVSGIHIYHSVICTAVNAALILYTNKASCHIYSFIFNFLYLIFFRNIEYFNLNYPPLHTNMVQMILTLKLVGVAFEVHDSHKDAYSDGSKKKTNQDLPNFLDMFHYAYCYIGVLTGPYYTYRTYTDYFKYEFYKTVNCVDLMKKKLMLVPLYAALFVIINYFFPVKYAVSDEFYTETTFLYRLFYIIPVFASFRMRIYVGLLLSEAACIIAGLGCYPEISEPQPGKGPTSNFDALDKISADSSLKNKSSFNFKTVLNIETWHTEFNPLMRSSIKYWNMCVQYWMAFIIYKRFPIRRLRTGVTFAVSAFWHGVYAGYYLCLCLAPFYLLIEDVWNSLLRKDAIGMKRKVLDVVFWFFRTLAFSYLGMAFSLLSMENGLRYYGSVYYFFHITSAISLLIGLAIKNLISKNNKIRED